jgi:hypothetical protein
MGVTEPMSVADCPKQIELVFVVVAENEGVVDTCTIWLILL